MIYDNNYTSSLFPIYLSPHFEAMVGYLLLKDIGLRGSLKMLIRRVMVFDTVRVVFLEN